MDSIRQVCRSRGKFGISLVNSGDCSSMTDCRTAMRMLCIELDLRESVVFCICVTIRCLISSPRMPCTAGSIRIFSALLMVSSIEDLNVSSIFEKSRGYVKLELRRKEADWSTRMFSRTYTCINIIMHYISLSLYIYIYIYMHVYRYVDIER